MPGSLFAQGRFRSYDGGMWESRPVGLAGFSRSKRIARCHGDPARTGSNYQVSSSWDRGILQDAARNSFPSLYREHSRRTATVRLMQIDSGFPSSPSRRSKPSRYPDNRWIPVLVLSLLCWLGETTTAQAQTAPAGAASETSPAPSRPRRQ